ncbi:MAG TPA: hypothetical protein VG295_07970 [Solirubrobacteraceae bacterium]|jgi:hypothetical protein|nr:hypothetical protein [Solirubrobacteraceae bacterium]
MGDVNVTDLPEIRFDPSANEIGIDEVKNIEPLRIAKIAPAAVHVKELNHIDPLTIESLRVDEVKNIDPVKVERFDVTSLPTVNLTIGQAPQLDLNLREIPPFALGLHQDFELPSEYFIRARVLGFEFLRVHVTGRTVMHPRDRTRREVSSSHERSYRELAAVGNPAIPVTCHEDHAEAVVHERPARHAPARSHRKPGTHAAHGMRVGAPPHAFALESAVSSG